MYLSTFVSYPMPDLFHTLLKYDLGHLRIIAGLWGLELGIERGGFRRRRTLRLSSGP